ncbi:hypothetical protein KAT59_05910, partial [Candidatus Bipolaricaulota bacterium]|nr:hypothetical protein [Candidatus Bipolaricaulota bacterium]
MDDAAISSSELPSELRLPRRYDTSVFAPRNDAVEGLLKKVSFVGGVGRPRPTPVLQPTGSQAS